MQSTWMPSEDASSNPGSIITVVPATASLNTGTLTTLLWSVMAKTDTPVSQLLQLFPGRIFSGCSPCFPGCSRCCRADGLHLESLDCSLQD